VEQALQLTKPGEYLMDAKAGAIYRPRPFYYVLETITRTRMQMKLIPDTMPERLIKTRTAVVTPDAFQRYPRTDEFVSKNYIRIVPKPREISVLGKFLRKPDEKPTERIDFDVVIPAEYCIVSPDKSFRCELDGTPLEGSRNLEAGRHELKVLQAGNSPVALIWERAWKMGYQPLWSHKPPKS
jgi:hypothetical protein